ncbi:iron-containing alcohol dehydrogenase [Brassicibacter mesophilus]|uniref:iron-containing alcohol dehydrogenase n=1 Tax=Brassicibacter mesophilus TaxID=745119 RepID=UPI003D1A2789
MMRPMKLAGEALVFGQGALDYLKTLKGKRASIVISGGSVIRNGYLKVIEDNLKEAGIETQVISGVEPDPTFDTVLRGAKKMLEFEPDWIIGLGGGSAMDAAKAMWVFYEHPELKNIQDIMSPNKVPALRNKAKMICIPTTSGTASEVSRSVVISDANSHMKYGIGDMEMMPDVALLEPGITASMPKKITAETGMDALTHAVEAYTSTRGNMLADTLAERAILDIFEYLPKAYNEGDNLEYREAMLNASMVAGLAFTNVSLGIVHSMAHTVGGFFGVPHGLADAVILPYIVEYNMQDEKAKARYEYLANKLGVDSLADAIADLNAALNVPKTLKEIIDNDQEYEEKLMEMAETAKKDGCTKTNPVIPEVEGFAELLKTVYYGK